ncbi:hypothetical protein [Celeribacter neptunius]|uniref:Uncharacterized protein n=1 Tax=Celeribacter neptunius TaxID=588602 RepID=A0A1I3PAR9_9RHOB|nr:hypothetical protein [Celeribacter neptunius]SFJ18437.1 hypothetical protein SAMN04487991_1612 [Celeribacter neptunius]
MKNFAVIAVLAACFTASLYAESVKTNAKADSAADAMAPEIPRDP